MAESRWIKGSTALSHLKLLRVSHWIKNGLVFLPIAFSGELFNGTYLVKSILAFAAFCFISSAVYINNDLSDIDADRAHPTKCCRPLASGAISPTFARITASVLLLASFAITLIFGNIAAFAILASYFILNLAYSYGLKNEPIIDIAILAAGFVLRVLYGGAFCNIPVSLWLFLTILAFATYFAFGKRHGEQKVYGSLSRKSLESYPSAFLASGMNIFLTLGLTFYSLWSYERIVPQISFVSLDASLLLVGVPLVMLICLRYSFIISQSKSDGDPANVLLSDKCLIALLVCWILTTILSIYALG